MSLLLPTLTAINSFGGYPRAPSYWKAAQKNSIFQLLTMSVLVYQSNDINPLAACLVAFLFIHIVLILYELEPVEKMRSVINLKLKK